jgi:hypothetical protein
MFGVARLALFAANPVAPAPGGASGGISYFFGGFTTGYSTNTRKYNLSTGASGSGQALPNAVMLASAFGNGTKGFVVGGFNGSAQSYSKRFTFADDTAGSWTWADTSGSSTLPNTQRSSRGASSATKGYSWGGYNTADRNYNHQLTYSSEVWASGTVLPFTGSPVQASHASVHSNSTYGIWIGGIGDATNLNYKQRMIYTWSDDSTSYTADGADYTHWLSASTGNQTTMYVVSGVRAGSTTTATTKYTISSGAVSAGGSVGTGFTHADAAGDDSVGICAGNSGAPTIANAENAYTYATDTATLLSAYLSNNQALAAETESLAACHSIQIS